jgi:hypothetical protein
LRAVSDEYGWIGGFDEGGTLCCVLPYTVIRKASVRLIRFRVETIPISEDFSIADEKEFLNSTINYLSSIRADIIIPATTNTIFRTYPDGAIAAPYGTYIVDLTQPEDVVWHNMSRGYRQDINNAIKRGLQIREGLNDLEKVHAIIKDTFKKSGLPFMKLDAFKRMLCGLGEHVKLFTAELDGEIQSSAVCPFSMHCAYGVYGGSISQSIPGAFKLIQWEAMKRFRDMGVRRFDFVGSRINPEKGSKEEGIMLFKKYFGGTLSQGYIWKYPFSKWKYAAYRLAIRFFRGGDIVDIERHKLINKLERREPHH